VICSKSLITCNFKEIWTSKFLKVVQQHIYDKMGIVTRFSFVLHALSSREKIEDQLAFDKVIVKMTVARFYGSQCIFHLHHRQVTSQNSKPEVKINHIFAKRVVRFGLK